MSPFDATQSDSAAFLRSFERWRKAVTSLVPPSSPVRCEAGPMNGDSSRTDGWSDGKIMRQEATVETTTDAKDRVARTEKELKREKNECKRCENWRDELTRESECDCDVLHGRWVDES